MKVILLPGLDGTGLLFKELLEALPSHFDIVVISLDDLSGSRYIEQAEELADRYSDDEVMLIAESYSGRLAYEWCGLPNSSVQVVVYLASFISSPSLLSKFAGYLPLSLLKSHRLNHYLLGKVGFSGIGCSELHEQVFESLQRADKRKLKQRLNNIAQLDMPTTTHTIPCVYIQPSHDYLVGKKAVAEVASLFNDLEVVKLNGGHFIAQLAPQECAKIIQETIAEN